MSTTAIGNYLTRGLEESLATTPIEDGKVRYTMDTGRCYLDFVDKNGIAKRIRITDVEFNYTEAEILALRNPVQNIYISKDTAKLFYNVNGSWKEVGALELTQDSENKEYVLWFSSTDSSDPKYNTGLTYNPSTNTLSVDNIVATKSVKVGNLVITETFTEERDHIVDFDFAE